MYEFEFTIIFALAALIVSVFWFVLIYRSTSSRNINWTEK
jgi:arginine exporter protein ArgO